FTATATPLFSTLSLHDALPIYDLLEQSVLVFLVIANQHGVTLLPRAYVPLLRRHNRWLVRGKPCDTEPEYSRCEYMCSVDHEREGVSTREAHASVECVRRRGRGFSAEVEIVEVATEAAHELFAELLVVVGPVLDDDHLVVDIVDPLLVCARQ